MFRETEVSYDLYKRTDKSRAAVQRAAQQLAMAAGFLQQSLTHKSKRKVQMMSDAALFAVFEALAELGKAGKYTVNERSKPSGGSATRKTKARRRGHSQGRGA